MKTGFFKKAAAVFMAGAMAVSLAGCADDSWSAKDDTQTLAAGVYIYNLYSAYREAQSQVMMESLSSGTSSGSTDFYSQQIDGKNVTQWMQDKAVLKTKETLYLDAKIKADGIEWTDEDQKEAEKTGTAAWAQQKSVLEGFGISKDSFLKAYSLYNAKYLKIFESVYGENGTEAVSDQELEKFFKDSYSEYRYFSKSLTTTGENGTTANLSDDEIAEIEKQFKEYAQQVSDGDKTPDEVASDYQTAEGLESSPLNGSVTLTENIALSSDLQTAFDEMKEGEARAIKSGTSYYFLYKGKIGNHLDELSTESGRMSVLAAMKQDEFQERMEKEISEYSCTMNDAAVSSYQPGRFGS